MPQKYYMVGRLLSNRPFNAQAMINTLKLIWKPAKSLSVETIDDNCFLFNFTGRGDLDHVLEGRPWFFERHVLLIDEIGLSVSSRNQVLESTPFWIQQYDLPISS